MYSIALDSSTLPSNMTEPMTLGSQPGSPSSPVSSNHVLGGSGYLPGFLMGDSSASAPSSNPRAWGVLPGSISPSKTRTGTNLAVLSSPSTPKASIFNPIQLSSSNREFHPHPSSDKHGGPPVQGLFDHPFTPSSSSTLRLPSHSSSVDRPNQSGAFASTPGMATSDSFLVNKSLAQDLSFPASPAQLDPFYSQGDKLRSNDELDECWITVFGFPPAAASYILQQFYHYGNIVDHKMSPNGNWMHIRYQTKLQAKIALSKNGKVFTGNIMVGVAPCIDKAVLNFNERRQSSLTSAASDDSPSINTSNCRSLSQPSCLSPVNVAYKYATHGHTVTSPAIVPQKSSGLITQALEYVFGW